MTDLILEARGVAQHHRTQRGTVEALAGVDLTVPRGEFLLLRGPSGAGKTTLLLALGGLARPTEGEVTLDGEELYGLSRARRRHLRGSLVGFVFQTMHLLPYLDARRNVQLGGPAADWLERLGLGEREHHTPSQLSGGERQRVALARALARRPELILADEPTGNLDPVSAGLVTSALTEFHREGGTVVLVTHARDLAITPDRELRLEAGRVVA